MSKKDFASNQHQDSGEYSQRAPAEGLVRLTKLRYDDVSPVHHPLLALPPNVGNGWSADVSDCLETARRTSRHGFGWVSEASQRHRESQPQTKRIAFAEGRESL